jgi:hypothetical protein
MGGQECFFGVNFADGRIKCYPTQGRNNGYFLRLVRGEIYGQNDFIENGDGTISDAATGLTWQQSDSGKGMDWDDSLAYCEALTLAGFEDWRLPDAKELQSIVDYTKNPGQTASPAIDSIFGTSSIVNEIGEVDYPFFWTSTTHKNRQGGPNAVYIAFGRALGNMGNGWIDVHGAGAQRSDPKTGDPTDYPTSRGPQGDVLRVFNYVRCVRGGDVEATSMSGGSQVVSDPSPPTNTQVAQEAPLAPPLEAVAACQGKAIDIACTFQAPDMQLTGICLTVPTGELACVPE